MKPVDIYLIRGLGREAGHWGDFIPLLESQAFVHSVQPMDLLGMGRFHKLTSPLTIEENAEFVLSQMDQKRDRPKWILSYSLGAMVAVEMIQKQTDLFHKVFVMNTSFSNLSPFYHRLQLRAFRKLVLIISSKDPLEREKKILDLVSLAHEKHETLAKQWAEVARKRPIRLYNLFSQLVAASRYKLAQKPPETPLVVLNSKKDRMVHPSCSNELARRWNLPLLTHPSAGHDLCVDDPHWVVEKLAETLV